MTTLFEAVSGSELDRHLRAISWVVRLSGTPEEGEAFYLVRRHQSDALVGYPRHASLELLSPDPAAIAANGYSLSPGTGPGGITADLAYAGAGRPEDSTDLDVRGKIVLM